MKKTKHFTDDPKWYDKYNTHTGYPYTKYRDLYKPKNNDDENEST